MASCCADIRRGHPAGPRRIGLLGGSFNPAHEGHLHVSRHAIRLLGLDAVWWLVAPQNPLKAADGMAPLASRLAAARDRARDPRIAVTDIELRMGTRYTVDTIAGLKRCFSDRHFVWLMGADNLRDFHRWRQWRRLFTLVPIAVFDRAPYSVSALAGKAANVFASSRLATRDARTLADRTPPAWIFFHTPQHPASATEIRAGRPVSAVRRNPPEQW